jgi:hypothetical protein
MLIRPVVASPLSAQTGAFLGSDGHYHLDYELLLSNTTATLQSVEVLDASKRDVVLKAYSGAELLLRLRALFNIPAKDAEMHSRELIPLRPLRSHGQCAKSVCLLTVRTGLP